MPNPLAQAHKSALRMNDDIGALFAQVGTSDHPRGFVLTAYRNAKRAMKAAMKEGDRLTAAMDIFRGLRDTIKAGSRSLFLDAQLLGADEAARQLRYYDIQTEASISATLNERVTSGAFLDAVLARIEAQDMTVRAMLLADADEAQIIGDDERAGIMRPSDIVAQVGALAATLVWSSFSTWTTSHTPTGISFSKQVVAGLDERTTDCCLRAHGQVVPLEKKFHLTGTPRYADYLEWTPFHHWCRSSIALYLSGYDDGLTRKMRESAARIMSEREAGGTGYRHPAGSFS